MEINMSKSKLSIKSLCSRTIKVVALVATLWLTLASVAMAQSFTFTSKNGEITQLGGDGTNGVPYTAMTWTGTATRDTGDGKTVKSTSTCIMMSQPPNDSLFSMHMVCDVTSSEGTFSTTVGCTVLNPETGATSCIGGMYGTGGTLKGRSGNITSHSKSSGADATGTGQWFE
ncbi:MAG: hypothetical protein ACI9XU_001587 [Arenicella sp.]|jgi:hypothetical protein